MCKRLSEFPDKFRDYYRMNASAFEYMLDAVKDVLQLYTNFGMCTEGEGKLTVALSTKFLLLLKLKM
jgi:hypothetical protein